MRAVVVDENRRASRVLPSVKRWLKRHYWRVEEFFSNKLPIYIIGDSHSGYFRFAESRNALIRVLQLPGATAYGLANENSATGARSIIHGLLSGIDRRSVVVFQFGEVDCAFLVWQRAQENNSSPYQEVVEACRNYRSFIIDTRDLGFDKVLVATVPPPTIADWKRFKGPPPIASFRQQVEASLFERTKYTKLFNQTLRNWSKTGLYRFIDVEDNYLDKATGLVRAELIVEDDLHLNWVKAREINLHEMTRMGIL